MCNREVWMHDASSVLCRYSTSHVSCNWVREDMIHSSVRWGTTVWALKCCLGSLDRFGVEAKVETKLVISMVKIS